MLSPLLEFTEVELELEVPVLLLLVLLFLFEVVDFVVVVPLVVVFDELSVLEELFALLLDLLALVSDDVWLCPVLEL